MKHLVAAALSAAALGACIHDDIYKPQNPFNFKEVAWAAERGINKISGKIDPPGADGKPQPCDKAWLAPDSAYTREMAAQVTGTLDDVMIAKSQMRFVMVYSDWERDRTNRGTDCGWKGHFSFERIPDGVWFFTAMGGPSKTGYFVQRRIEVRGGQTLTINIP
jgi:hypothetical protein